MRLGISNIAWDPRDDEALATLLRSHEIDAIDIAPGKYFPTPENATEVEVGKLRAWWRARGIEITGMQALLFGTSGLNIFSDDAVQGAMLERLRAVCRIAGLLGAPRLVFGSPRNRDRGDLDEGVALRIASEFFRRLGDIARHEGVLICLEPNPERYGCNFMTTGQETARVVSTVDHPAICMQLDTGAMHISGEDVGSFLAQHADLIGHIHASEPGLVPLGDGGVSHQDIAHAIWAKLPNATVTVEMLEVRDEPVEVAIDRALRVAKLAYGAQR
jgi:D-psicose/D-tagatose/L-ribulose 3-epimerase